MVDDSVPNRKILCRVLQSGGFICNQAENGEVAVNMVKQSMESCDVIYDVILMDFEMPVMDGPTATRVIKSLGCVVPIIGVTGNVLPADTNTFLHAGVLVVLSKPLTLSALNTVLDDLSRKRSASGTADDHYH